jgi:replicative DNA helicase
MRSNTSVQQEASSFPKLKEYEQKLLGHLLWEPGQLMQAIKTLKPCDFRYEKHALIFNAMLELNKEGIELNVLTLWEQLRENGNLETAGGSSYITYLPLLSLEGSKL